MPRHRPRLGQGLEALVSPLRIDPPAEAPQPLPPAASVPSFAPVAWEYALLTALKGKRGRDRGSVVTVAPGELLGRPARRKLRGVPALVALGVLGSGGWELVSVQGLAYVLRRPVISRGGDAGLRSRYLG
jgi:hypothetical protein